ncbi:putative major facilitator, sugar transporter, major facilitator superfamily [Helianthus annuus]|uniref:Major facilitator, sugar transporter, major facilitator superfamily n=2 Tax=Helianthus annuus TaxID=4232 RepID=A0A251S3R4_HELAN|nr:putative major facilitator, sugar transporter, major facilitator superfamily [Helianthus annuus]KAJ0462614.1 putative major facilitator, sugar transporter, major facilitator superfamily [Helianthus annuus]KAJ0683614.1 putative major facilitator, sugar transporter, major facilitator superfamily [Helianthus annuus]KAJ0838368.1 putative major facilitator, sugar transporter, major facilitator superfamily [Helianthus annuus]
MTTKGAVYVAIAASMGNMLQGWDNATIAGAVLYIKKEFHLETQPTIEGLIVSMSLIGATVITTFSGSVSDAIGRRPMLIISSLFYFMSGLVMFWSPSVYVLLVARLLDGFGIGLAVTLVPLYISETAPSDIRGLLNTFPQFTGCVGMFLAYTMVFFMSLQSSASWRMMLGVLSLPSIAYFILAVFYLPESPRWLVSKGKMDEAKHVLQLLRGKEDVSGEMALLVEGLEVGGETSVEEYEINADNELSEDHVREKDEIKLYGAEEGQSWVAKPVRGQSSLVLASRQGSVAAHMMDPMVTLFGSVHEKQNEMGSMRSMIFPTFGSMFQGDQQQKPDNWDVESNHEKGNLSEDETDDNNLKSPLISPNARQPGETTSAMGIGGGWQLAYRKSEDGKNAGGLKRIYLHQETGAESRRGSVASLLVPGPVTGDGDVVRASALVSRSVLCLDGAMGQNPIQSGAIKPPPSSKTGTSWSDLAEPGIKQALIVGVGIQILQQFSGINGVLYYTPQILEQAGVGILLANMGIGSESASFLISGVTTLLMLPSIGVAMKLIDLAGRRMLLLATLPVLLASLIVLVLSNTIPMDSVVHAVISTVSVVVYFCTFVMGFGPIPNTLCSEIFPTRVRGLCIAICALTFWVGDIIVTYTLPVLLTTIGLAGAFGIYAVVCTISWFFVYFKVPETKGMPLEVITEFFAMGAANKKAN